MAKKKASKKSPTGSTTKKSTKKVAGKKAANKSAKKSSKRELISPNRDARFVRRDGAGQFKESDDVGRSQQVDRRKKAKRAVKSGDGDKGDRKKR
jgi:hypothetical protein